MYTKADGEDLCDDFLKATEVAGWFRVARSTIYGWKAAGRIPHVMLHGAVRFRRHQLIEWLREQTIMPGAPQRSSSEGIRRACPHPVHQSAMAEAAARVKKRLLSPKTVLNNQRNK
jgi:excisionase family DNA binding protein